MSNHLGDTNKMVSDTPRTDAVNQYLRTRRDYTKTDHEVCMKHGMELERELNAANERIKRLEEAIQERDKEWFQVIESILGFHPVSMTEALRIGIERIKKQKQRIKRLEEALEGTVKWIVHLADSGDAGFWDVEKQSEIIAARAALKKESKP